LWLRYGVWFVKRAVDQKYFSLFKFTATVKEKEREREREREGNQRHPPFPPLLLHLQGKTENKTTAEMKNNSFRTEPSTQ